MPRDLFDHDRLVEQKIQDAIRDGQFDHLPRGRLAEQDRDYEPNWWLKRLMEREDLARAARVPRATDLRDRLALIEQGQDASIFRKSNNRHIDLRNGMVALMVGTGLLIGYLLERAGLPGFVAYPAMVLILGGLGLIGYYLYLGNRVMEEEVI